MTPVCDHCSGDITRSNRAHPGYCSPWCRDTARQQRQAARRPKPTEETA